MKRKPLLLIILLLVLALAVGYAFWATPRQQRVNPASRQAPGDTTPTAKGLQAPREDGVRLDLLEEKTDRFPGYSRNIFGSILPPPPPSKPVVKAPPVAAAAPAPSPPPAAAAPAAPVLPQLASFTFLGYLEKGGEKTVFLSQDDELFVVKKGDRFGADKEFQVVGLTPEELVIAVRGESRQITVPLVENQPLIPAFKAGKGGRSPAAGRPSFPRPSLNMHLARPAPPALPATGAPEVPAPGGQQAPEPGSSDIQPPEPAPPGAPAVPDEVMQ